MAYLTIARISGDPDTLLAGYQQSSGQVTEVGRDHGLILHAAAKTDEGLLIVNLWPSKDGSEAAARDQRRRDVIQQHGLKPDDFHREHHEVVGYVLFDGPEP
jgi:hypothetical protein